MPKNKVTFIAGVMNVGKTKDMINGIIGTLENGKVPLAIKPVQDTRDVGAIKSRALPEVVPCLTIDDRENLHKDMLYNLLNDSGITTLYIDEVQFFSRAFIETLMLVCKLNGINVMATGLLQDFNGDDFPSSAFLKDYADCYDFYKGDCHRCQGLARHIILVTSKDMRRIRLDGMCTILPDKGLESVEYINVCDYCIDHYK